MRDFLLEIGVEELPPREASLLAAQLKATAEALLKEERLDYEVVAVYYTPRRLVLYIKGLDEEQEGAIEEVRGPSRHAGFDEEGKPTRAAQGFARSHGAAVEDLIIKSTPQGEYLFLERAISGQSTAEILPELVPRLIERLSPTETMRWDDSGLRFIRPIRWLLCLFGEEAITFDFGRLRAGNVSRGHRLLGKPQLHIENIQGYFQSLQQNGIILDQVERRARIEEALQAISGEIKAHPVLTETLLGEISDNLEHPTPVLGRFPERFLTLPREVLETTLVEHQKFVPFAVGKKASPHFVGFRDGPEDQDGTVRRGYERVVVARLEDSVFFFEEDRKQPLADRVAELRSVVFQDQLGTIWDKVERMRKCGAKLAARLGYDAEREAIDRTIYLCKADLLTQMVREFPDLEGIMGGIYARLDGEPEPVWQGIYEHYLPKAADDPVPESVTGIVTALADKLDTVMGSLFLGEEPTGSRDPYGLRRKANGVVRILLERELDLDILELIRHLKELYAFLPARAPIQRVEDFLLERLARELRDNYGIPYDVVEAVTATREGSFLSALRKAQVLETLRDDERFQSLVTAFTRVANITRGHHARIYDPQRFQEEAERELWRTALKAEGHIRRELEQGDYEGVIAGLISLRDPIDGYFDEVLVMAHDKLIRENRLAFLTFIRQLFFTIGDLSKIVVEGGSDDGDR